MPRVIVELPKKFIFSTDIAVRISDINYGGHLGHDSIISLIHEARVRFLKDPRFCGGEYRRPRFDHYRSGDPL